MLLRGALGPVLAAVVLFSVVGVLGVVAVQLVQAPVTPGPDVASRLLLCALPVVASTGGPLAVLTGFGAALMGWRRAGRWRALMASGVGASQLVPGVLALALLVGSLTATCTHRLEPQARASARDALLEPLRPRPGRLLSVAGLALHAEQVEGDLLLELFFAVEDTVGSARAGELTDEALVLHDGRVLAGETLVEFDLLRIPLPEPSPRVQLVERSDAALADLVERMIASGKDARYEASILHKRTSWPVGAALLILMAPPLVLGRRTLALAVSPVVFFGLVRLCDHAVGSLGALGSAWLPVGLLVLANLAAWTGWRDR
ncbi:MAG: LptF/LptG family permease [Proteobacteria bacterium]|nr:LptF/LptG family permease [Pseudomonadota bacterium]